MFSNLSEKILGSIRSLSSRGVLSEDDIDKGMRQIRIALLEADVALPVVKSFISKVKEKSLGREIVKSVQPGQQLVKIIHDELVELLGSKNSAINLSTVPPAVILVAGLQGSGKTTSTAKLAHYLTHKHNKKVLAVSLDVYRPAAREQLKIMCDQIDVKTTEINQEANPLTLLKSALKQAKQESFDCLLIDTAGRLHIDDEMMKEIEEVQVVSRPIERLLVVDAMTGQDAVNIAKLFHERLNITGIILTRMDGDARGGAALSMKEIVGCPLKFMGVGEKIDAFEVFDANRVASRILDQGDIVALVEKAQILADDASMQVSMQRMQKGHFTLVDMEKQLLQVVKMGGMQGLLGALPGMQKLKNKVAEAKDNEKIIHRQVAVIRAMTLQERRMPTLFNASRRKRVARGAGVEVSDVNKLLKQHEQMQKMMKRMKGLGEKGLMRGGLKSLFKI